MLQKELSQLGDEVRRKLRALEPDYTRFQQLRMASETALEREGIRASGPVPYGHLSFPNWLIAVIDGLGGQRL